MLILTTSLSTAGILIIQDNVVIGIANEFFPLLWGWILWGVTMIAYILSRISRRRTELSVGR